MKIKGPKYVHQYTDCRGHHRVYYNRPGARKVSLPGPVGAKAFWEAYYEAEAGTVTPKAVEPGAARVLPGSLREALLRYFASSDFKGLASSTQKTTRRVLEKFSKGREDRPLKGLQRKHVKSVLDKMQPGAATAILKKLKVFTAYAREAELIPADPLADMKAPAYEARNIHTWTESEAAQFISHHGPGTKAYLAFALMYYTGQRRSDAIRMGWGNVSNGFLSIKQQKTKTDVTIPVDPALMAVIDLLPRKVPTFLTTEYGRPFASSAAFGNCFRDRCNEADLPHCSAHGLRSSMAARLATAGATPNEIAAFTGHKTLSEVARYTKAADQKVLATAAMQKLGSGTKSANAKPKVSKIAG